MFPEADPVSREGGRIQDLAPGLQILLLKLCHQPGMLQKPGFHTDIPGHAFFDHISAQGPIQKQYIPLS